MAVTRRRTTAPDPQFSDPGDDGPVLEGEVLDRDPEPTRRARTPRAGTRTGSRGKIPVRTATGKIMSEKEMRAQVHDEIVMYLTLIQGGVAMRDRCADAVTEQTIHAMADAMVSMIARNKKLLAKAATTGIIGDIVRLGHAVMPVVKMVWMHHGPGGMHHGDTMGDNDRDHWADQYPAPTLA